MLKTALPANALCKGVARKLIVLAMHLTIIFLTAICLTVHASGISQSVTISQKNISLRKVFSIIEQQTGYYVFSNENLMNNTHPVTLSVKDMPLNDVLNVILQDQLLNYRISGKTIILSRKITEERITPLFSPPLPVRGRITDLNGKPLAGATILLKKNKRSWVTDAEGQFSLVADEGDILVISFVGYTAKEIKVSRESIKNGFVGNIPLAAATSVLDEMVVTAYGIEKRTKELGYSSAKVTGEELNRANPSNLLTGLTGRVSGLNISTTGAGINPQIRVLLRGIRSFGETTNNLPLFIFNGAPLSFGGDQQAANIMMEFINNINPNDVDNVTILKGANGAALYGPEGVNGVIIINTKKGKTKPQVNFRHSTMLQTIDARYPKLQTRFGAGSTTDQFGQGVYDPFGSNESWGAEFDGEMKPIGRPDENGERQMVPYKYTKERYKFWDIGQTIQNTASVSQGDNRSDFYLSAGHAYLTSLTPGDRTSRFSLMMNAGRQFGIIHTRINFGYTKSMSNVFPGQPNVLVSPAQIPFTSYKDFRNYKWADHNHYWADNSTNPYEDIAISRSKTNGNALFGNFTLTLLPVKWLKITNRTGINYYGSVEKQTTEPIIYSAFGKTNGRPASAYGDRKASVKDDHKVSSSLSNDLLVNTQFKMGLFSLKTTLGNTLRNNLFERVLVNATALLVPVYNIAFSGTPAVAIQTRVLSRSYSFFGTSTLGYKDWAFFELTGRQDWDSRIASIARSKNYYYGANTSVVLGEAIPSIVNGRFLSGVRLRASVTKTANMNVSPYEAESILGLRTVYANVISYGFATTNYPNPLVQPENVISQEYGVAASVLKNRIKLDVTYYRQRNNGVIAKRQISMFTGYTSTVDNLGDFLNYGWEFDLDVNPLFKLPGGWSSNVQGMFSLNDNKILAIGVRESDDPLGGLPGGPPIFTGSGREIIRQGGPAYAYAVADWLRDDKGRVIVDRITGMPSVDSKNPIITGRSLPKYFASFNFHLLWKNLGLHMVGEYHGGYDHYFRNATAFVQTGNAALTAQYGRQRFIFPNSVYDDGSGKFVENTSVPVRSGHAEFYKLYSETETNFLISGAFWKLREVSLSYDWELKKSIIKTLTITLAGRNLLVKYPKTNPYGDPELTTGAGTVVREDQTSASNLNGVFSEGTIGGSRFFGASLNIGF